LDGGRRALGDGVRGRDDGGDRGHGRVRDWRDDGSISDRWVDGDGVSVSVSVSVSGGGSDGGSDGRGPVAQAPLHAHAHFIQKHRAAVRQQSAHRL
jgi:hypothetical protein